MQYWFQSSGAGLLCWYSGDKDHLDGDLPHHTKQKGILEEAPICDSASSNDATSPLKSWTTSPVSPTSSTWDDGGEHTLLSIGSPFGSVLMLPHGITKSEAFVS